MSHLGSRLSALVDGRLGVTEAERVMAHVAGCGPCADELVAERQARRALNAARDVAPEPDFAARLLAMRPMPGASTSTSGLPVPSRPGPRLWSDTAAFADSVRLPGEPAPAAVGSLPGQVSSRRRMPAVLGVASCVAVLLVGLIALGDRGTVSPQTHRSYALQVLSEAVDASTAHATTARLDGRAGASAGPVTASLGWDEDIDADVSAWLTRHGWAAPRELPPGWTIEAVRPHAHTHGALEMDLEGPHGTVVVVQQRGKLAPERVADLPTREIAGRTVHVASRDPWHVVWQCGDVVVAVFAEGRAEAVQEVVDAHPLEGYDDGVPARVARGWSMLAGAWTP